MDVRLYIVAATFALMVLSLITVVVIAARVRHREKPVRLEEHPSMPPVSMNAMSPVDTDLRGLEVPVPENSPHAALLKPLAEKPVWEEPTRSATRAEQPPRREPEPPSDPVILAEKTPSAPEPDAAAVELPAPQLAAAVIAPEPASAPEPTEAFLEGPGRIPQIGRREVRRLPSADEILASLEAEMARQEADQHQPAESSGAREDVAADTREGVDSFAGPQIPVREHDVEPQPAVVARTASAAGVPAEQVQWKPAATPTEEPPAVADPIEERSSVSSPLVERTPAPERPPAVVRAAQPPAPAPEVEPAPVPAEPRPAVRVAGIRVPLKAGEDPAAAVSAETSDGQDESGNVPEIELSSPVEMWFGDHRVGVKQGTATFDRLQRYADALLNDLHDSRDNTTF